MRRLILFTIVSSALIAISSHAIQAASRQGIRDELPSGWTMEAPAPGAHSIHFVSPDGSAWLALSKEPAQGSVADHMQSIASSDGMNVTYLRQGRSWIVVSGFKGVDRIFYRKAMVACNGRAWHEIAFEYPAVQKKAFDRLVTRISRALGAHKHEGCRAK